MRVLAHLRSTSLRNDSIGCAQISGSRFKPPVVNEMFRISGETLVSRLSACQVEGGNEGDRGKIDRNIGRESTREGRGGGGRKKVRGVREKGRERRGGRGLFQLLEFCVPNFKDCKSSISSDLNEYNLFQRAYGAKLSICCFTCEKCKYWYLNYTLRLQDDNRSFNSVVLQLRQVICLP